MIRAGLTQVIAQIANRVLWLPAYRSLTSLTEGDRTNTTLTKPAAVASGDKLVAGISMSGATGYDPVVTPPAGWTLLTKRTHTGADWVSHTHWYWKDAGASEPASYTWNHATGLGSSMMFAISETPLGAPTFTAQNGTGNTSTALSLTTTRSNQVIAFLSEGWNAHNGTRSAPTGTTPAFTERLDTEFQYIYLATGVLASAGATGNKTHVTNNGASDPWSALLIAF